MAFDLAQSISQSMGGIGDALVQRRQQQLLQSDLKRIFDTLQPEKKRSVERRMEGIMGRGDDLERQLMEEGASPMAAVGSRGQRSRARTEQPAFSTQGNLQSDLSRTLQNMQTPEGLQMGMDLMQQHRKMQQEQQLSQQEQRQEMQMDELEHRRRMEREAFGEQAQLERQSKLSGIEHQQDLRKAKLEASLEEPDTFSKPIAMRHSETGETQTFVNKSRAAQAAQQGYQPVDDESGGIMEPKNYQKEAQILQRQMSDLRAGKDIPSAWGKDRETAISQLRKARDINLNVAAGRLDPRTANERLAKLGAPSSGRATGGEQQQQGQGQQTPLMDNPPAPEDLEGTPNIQDYEKSMGFGNMLKRVTQEGLGWAVPGTLFKEEAMSANKVRYMNQRLRDKLKVSQHGARWDMEQINKMLPAVSTFRDPDTAKERVQILHDNVSQMLREKEKFLEREGVSKSAINKVQKDIQKLQEVQSAIPNPREDSAPGTSDEELSNRISEVPVEELRSADIGTIEQLVDRYGAETLLNNMNSDQKRALRERIQEQKKGE